MNRAANARGIILRVSGHVDEISIIKVEGKKIRLKNVGHLLYMKVPKDKSN